MISLGQRLVNLRKEHGLTQQQVAERIWVNKATISSYELSTRTPSFDSLIKLSKLFGVTTDYLLGIDDRKSIDVTDLNDKQISILLELVDQLKKTDK